jgi:hypothetical protein
MTHNSHQFQQTKFLKLIIAAFAACILSCENKVKRKASSQAFARTV